MADKFRVDMEVGFNDANDGIRKGRQQVAEFIKALEEVKRLAAEANVSVKRLFDQKFGAQRQLSQVLNMASRGSYETQVNTAAGGSARANVRGTANYQLLETERLIASEEQKRIALGKQLAQQARSEQVIIEKTLTLENARLKLQEQYQRIASAKLTGNQSALKEELNNLRQLEAEYARLKQAKADASRSPQLSRDDRLEQSRINAVERITGDGGASLLAIQARLLVNYKLLEATYGSVGFIGRFTLELDAAFKQLQAVTAITGVEMGKLETKLLDVAETTKFSAVEVAEAATILGQAGFSSGQIEKSIEAVTLLATAVGTDLKTAVGTATSILNVFGLQAGQMDDVVNTITAAVNRSKLSMEQYTLGLQYSANIAADAGVEFEELTAVLGLLANAGIRSGSTLGTGTRQLLNTFAAPTQKMVERLQHYGLTLEDISVETNGFIGVLKNLTEAGFSTSDALQTMELRAANTFSALAGQLDSAERFQQQILLTNAAAEANEIQMKSLRNTIDNLTSAFGAAGFTGLQPFATALQGVLEELTKVISGLREYPGVLQTITSLFLGFGSAAIIGALGKTLKGLLTLGGAMRTTTQLGPPLTAALVSSSNATTKLGLAVGGLTRFFGPLGLALTGISLAIAALTPRTGELASSLENLKARSSELENSQAEVSTALTQVDATMLKMIRRSERLEDGSAELRTVAIEAAKAFNQFGAGIDYTSESFETLYQKLEKVQGPLREHLALLAEQARLNQEQIYSEQKRLVEETRYSSVASRALSAAGFERNERQVNARTGAVTGGEGNLGVGNAIYQIENVNRELVTQMGRYFARLDQGLPSRQETAEAQAVLARFAREGELNGSSSEQQRFIEAAQQILTRVTNDLANTEAERLKTVAAEEAKAIADFVVNNPDLDRRLNQLEARRQQAEDQFGQASREGREFEARKVYEATLQQIAKEVKAVQGLNEARLFGPAFGEKQVGIQSDIERSLLSSREKAVEDELKLLEQKTRAIDLEVQLLQKDARNESPATQRAIRSQVEALMNQRGALDVRKTELETIKERQAFDATQQEKLLGSEFVQENIRLVRQQSDLQLKSILEGMSQRIEKDSLTQVTPYQDSVKALEQEFTRQRNSEEQARRALELKYEARAQARDARTSTEGGVFVSAKTQREAVLQQMDDEIAKTDEIISLIRDQIRAEEARQESLRANIQEYESLMEETRRQYESEEESALRKRQLKKEYEELNSSLETMRGSYISGQKAVADFNAELGSEEDQKKAQEQQKFYRDNAATVGQTFRDVATEWDRSLTDMHERNQRLSEGFTNVFGQIRSGLGQTVKDVVTGTATMSQAFRGFAASVIESMLEVAAQQAATGFLSVITPILGSALGSFFGSGMSVTQPTANGYGNVTGIGTGGLYAQGGEVRGGVPGRDSVPILTTPGEFVLRKSAVDAIGLDTLHQLNSLSTQQSSSSPERSGASAKGGTVNVYVVSKDKMPPLGPNDVLAVVNEDLSRGGQTAKLVKSVVLS